MCFSAAVSYSAAAVLVSTGGYGLYQARRLPYAYRLLALAPLFFGIQQAFEGRLWQALDAGNAEAAISPALGFLFFSHFLWLWWFSLCGYLLESGKIRRWFFLGLGLFGALAGGVVYFSLMFHPEWLNVSVKHHSVVYDIASPYRGPVRMPVPASVLYALIVLVPLLASSHRRIRLFGALIFASMVPISLFYGYAFVSLWCLFAAVLSLYLVDMIRKAAQA